MGEEGEERRGRRMRVGVDERWRRGGRGGNQCKHFVLLSLKE